MTLDLLTNAFFFSDLICDNWVYERRNIVFALMFTFHFTRLQIYWLSYCHGTKMLSQLSSSWTIGWIFNKSLFAYKYNDDHWELQDMLFTITIVTQTFSQIYLYTLFKAFLFSFSSEACIDKWSKELRESKHKPHEAFLWWFIFFDCLLTFPSLIIFSSRKVHKIKRRPAY